MWEMLEKELPASVPVDLMRRVHGGEKNVQEHLPRCRRMPSPAQIAINNDQWQVLRFEFDVYMYSAHYDDRRYPEEEAKPAVRILTLINRLI